MINNQILDPKNGFKSEIIKRDNHNALVVTNTPLIVYENFDTFFINETYGNNLNKNALASGTPVQVHNGIDTVLWTASDIVGGGKTTFNSTDFAYEGTHSIKVDNSPVGDVFQLAKGSALDCNDYVSLTMWIYVDKDWKLNDSISIYGWNTVTNTQIGNEVFLQDYFNWYDFDQWHQIKIPLIHMGDVNTSTVLDAIRIRIVTADGKSPKFYLDTIQFEEIGDSLEYIIKPSIGTWFYVYGMRITIVNNINTTLTDSTMLNLSYDKMFGETLSVGLNYKRVIDNKIISSESILSLLHLMQLTNVSISATGSDGTNSFIIINVVFTEPLLLKDTQSDYISWIVNDDLSGFLNFRISATGKIDNRD